ncbi:MAG: phosphopantetheine adenylyltransferase [Methanotrichaceae archaeon]|nr:phosphopantetheine adenylyltransferase [Methanotrichaceae archaeon]
MARVAVGGTFDPIHDGHIALLHRAFDLGENGEVVIGLTSDEMARSSRARPVRGFDTRLRNLQRTIEREIGVDAFKVIKISDQCGSSIYEDFDYIVVSPETLPVAQKINRLREKRGLKPIKISVIEYQMAQDHMRISSTRIIDGKIDRHGKVLFH